MTAEKTKEELVKMGYNFYRSLKAGSNSTYSFRLNGEDCAIGFDSIGQAVAHVNKQLANDKSPFMIF